MGATCSQQKAIVSLQLLDLPDDLLCLIVEHVHRDDRFATALSCRRLKLFVRGDLRTSASSLFKTKNTARLEWAATSGKLPLDQQWCTHVWNELPQHGTGEHVLCLARVAPVVSHNARHYAQIFLC